MKSTVLLASVLLCVLFVSADPAHAQVQSCAGQPLGTPCDTDGDPCTNVGFCFSGTCMNEIPVPNGTSCEDGLFCTGSDTCQSGVCVGGSDPCPGPDGDGDCSERCNETADACTRNDPNGSGCNDGNVCTTGDTCGAGACFGVNAPNGTSCASDGTFCNGAEECQSGL